MHLALVASCLLLAGYLPVWYKSWFVAESGHFGGRSTLELLLLFGLYRRWQPALGIMYALLALQLLVVSAILYINLTTGGPTLGFFLTDGLLLTAWLLLYFSTSLNDYLKSKSIGRLA